MPIDPQDILDFWFGPVSDPNYGKPRKSWFVKDLHFDQQIREHFLDLHQLASRGDLRAWQAQPLSCLALILMLDQVPRHLFRNQPQAFASDALALTTADFALDQSYDRQLLPVQQWFLFLPFEHSEDLTHQRRAVHLFAQLDLSDPENASCLDYAKRHMQVIERFGRFPHRNRILGRSSTPDEITFLQQPGSSF